MVKSIIIKTLKSHLIKITKQWMKKRTIHSWIGSLYPYRGKGLQNVKKLGGDKPMRWGQPATSPMEIGLAYLPKIVGTSPHVPKKIRRTYTSLSGYLKLDLSRPITSEVSWERRKKLSSPPKNVLVNLNLKTNVIQFVELQVIITTWARFRQAEGKSDAVNRVRFYTFAGPWIISVSRPD